MDPLFFFVFLAKCFGKHNHCLPLTKQDKFSREIMLVAFKNTHSAAKLGLRKPALTKKLFNYFVIPKILRPKFSSFCVAILVVRQILRCWMEQNPGIDPPCAFFCLLLSKKSIWKRADLLIAMIFSSMINSSN